MIRTDSILVNPDGADEREDVGSLPETLTKTFGKFHGEDVVFLAVEISTAVNHTA